VDWFDFFELAQEWVDEDDEAHKRSAVSRAYYAMYCTARDKLCDANRFHPSKCESKHAYVWKKYKEDPGYPDRIHIGRLGSRLHRRRIEADYHGFIDDFPDLVEHAMDIADELKVALEDPTLTL
jgi:uncharacterized protein (UPF0332 family)